MRAHRGSLLIAALVFTAACAGDVPEDSDHDSPVVTFEGSQVTDQLDENGVSPRLDAPTTFQRLAVLWDGEPDSFELRISGDGTTWSEWMTPDLVSAEEEAHVGRLDVVGEAKHFQYRVLPGKTAPTFLALDAIEEMPIVPDDSMIQNTEADRIADDEAAEADEPDTVAPGVSSTESAITTPIGSVNVRSRNEWRARSPRCRSYHTPTRVTIHHTVSPNTSSSIPKRLRQIQNYHMDGRGYCDIAYNFLIGLDGSVWRGRGSKVVGGHTANNNTGNVGISYIGTYVSKAPSHTQMCNTAKLIRWLSGRYGGVDLNRKDVKGHRQYGGTVCPGEALYRKLDRIVSMARNGC